MTREHHLENDGAREREHYFDVGGVRARVLEAGEGAPVVVLASPVVQAATYRPLLRALAPHARALAVDLPGAGRSSPVRSPFTFDEHAAWACRLLERLGARDVTLLGHSNSGAVALLAAARAPAGLARLALVDSVGARPRRSVPRVLAARFVDALDPAEWGLNARGAPHVAGNLWRHARSFLYQVRAGSHADVLAEAGRVRVPAWLAWGRRDRTMPLACAERFAAALPDASIHVGPGSHDWLVTHPEAFARALLAFVAAKAAPGAFPGDAARTR